jgi:2-haloacid dehalogenase
MMTRFALLVLLGPLAAGSAMADTARKSRFKAIAFDYFVLFNPDSVIPAAEKEFPGKGRELTKLWRTKQFEYGFLRSITHDHRDFLEVTGDALVYATQMLKLPLDDGKKERLLHAYLSLQPWPDTVEALRKLKGAGLKIITIANFSPKMLRDNADGAGITSYFDDLLSTAVNQTYKPDANAYQLGMQTLGLNKDEIVFAAFGGWDAYGAKKFGYPTYWVNRFNLPPEQLGLPPNATSNDIAGLLDFVFKEPWRASSPSRSPAK